MGYDSQMGYASIEKGTIRLNIDQLEKLAIIFKVPISYFFELEESKGMYKVIFEFYSQSKSMIFNTVRYVPFVPRIKDQIGENYFGKDHFLTKEMEKDGQDGHKIAEIKKVKLLFDQENKEYY
ncbi:MAG: hypothetical protein CMO01_08140 [Thalassobius sp.]|nr:hypothetical protein [Thalassovita sp.]|tara:strand:- start:22 stop:390 length:369 start_codon:yes stop_codon:yes gene_type:complete